MRTFKINLANKRFNKVTAISFSHEAKGHYFWNCLCDCGKQIAIDGDKLRQGRVYSCGCERYKRIGEIKATHGHTKNRSATPEYYTWHSMKARCTNPKNSHYACYGGRGIKVCDSWLASFENFLADMGSKPANTQIDRIDNNGDYCPENCRWVSKQANHMNRRITYMVEWDGKQIALLDLCNNLLLPYHTIWQRLERMHWTLDKAISTPVRPCKR